jgi:hypothetical protein
LTQLEEDEILDLADDLDRQVEAMASQMNLPISRVRLTLGMLFKDKRAPSAWAGFQKTFKDTNKEPHDQSKPM